jgi:hypothetical protein
MPFRIRMGVPEMEACWNDLSGRELQGRLDKHEARFFKKFVKALGFLGQNPRHPGLASHEIGDLTRQHGIKIFQSYLENNTPAAGRLFWAYGPDQGDITVLAIEPHPEDQKRRAYLRIKLSALPPRQPWSKSSEGGPGEDQRQIGTVHVVPCLRFQQAAGTFCSWLLSRCDFVLPHGKQKRLFPSSFRCFLQNTKGLIAAARAAENGSEVREKGAVKLEYRPCLALRGQPTPSCEAHLARPPRALLSSLPGNLRFSNLSGRPSRMKTLQCALSRQNPSWPG